MATGTGGEAKLNPPQRAAPEPLPVAASDTTPPPAVGNTEHARRLIRSKGKTTAAATDVRLQALQAAMGLHITGYSVGRLIDPLPLALELAESVDHTDPIQKLAAHQMAVLHVAGMQALGRGLSDWNRADAKDMLGIATRCFSTFAKLTEAIARRQHGGEQRVVVQHVDVCQGGQAVIGTVQMGDRKRSRTTRRRGDGEKPG
ncbi:MAG: hypothetical protein U1F68_15705 [Gammaproteobacteria bacterium]